MFRKNTVRFIIMTALLVFSLLRTQGQDYIEIGQLGYRYSFPTSASDGDTARSVYGARFNILLPVKISEKTYFLPGFRFWQYRVDPGENFKWYLFQAGIQTQISEKWNLQVLPLLRTGIYQDAKFGDGFQVGVLLSANKQINEDLMLGYGIYTNHELFGQLLQPFLAIDWQISDRWRLFGSFPMYNTLSYSINERWNTGLNYIGLVTSFMGDGVYTERSSLDFDWFIEYYITPQIVAQARFGYPVDRTFEEYAEGDKVDFTLSLLRFGNDRELLREFDKSQFLASFNLFFRVKK
ncbi:DUF6268 family outer membrane beta-barrel protein [Fulvivirga sedimenti]|uniref:DUF6268 family outer membrane beta-barrel protein n=1 Tax=Fulvivirga sedimenti TaxID=2879465 RepID=A0A9X1HUP0_9BACT|nr:DUF6268 family outer membrane beta-barrel protein [Fulvivirga sedimenti]MCA6078639.1 DUF6268 family outer membrane beta-barrel protein [Fulvivirga sedimenti]